jgi:predicted DNA-binding protein (UPF0251 family)
MSFKPCGISRDTLEEVILRVDELEAIRLADFEGMYQEEAAKAMNVSRQTFGNIISNAHKKVAEFLLKSRFLTIEGGQVELQGCKLSCDSCQHEWVIQCESPFPKICPACESSNFYCVKISLKNHKQKCWRNQ